MARPVKSLPEYMSCSAGRSPSPGAPTIRVAVEVNDDALVTRAHAVVVDATARPGELQPFVDCYTDALGRDSQATGVVDLMSVPSGLCYSYATIRDGEFLRCVSAALGQAVKRADGALSGIDEATLEFGYTEGGYLVGTSKRRRYEASPNADLDTPWWAR